MRTGGAQRPERAGGWGPLQRTVTVTGNQRAAVTNTQPWSEVIIGKNSWQLLLVAWAGRGRSPGPTRTSQRVQKQGATGQSLLLVSHTTCQARVCVASLSQLSHKGIIVAI